MIEILSAPSFTSLIRIKQSPLFSLWEACRWETGAGGSNTADGVQASFFPSALLCYQRVLFRLYGWKGAIFQVGFNTDFVSRTHPWSDLFSAGSAWFCSALWNLMGTGPKRYLVLFPSWQSAELDAASCHISSGGCWRRGNVNPVSCAHHSVGNYSLPP